MTKNQNIEVIKNLIDLNIKLSLSNIIVVGQWKSISQFIRRFWNIEIQEIHNHPSIHEIHMILQPAQQEKGEFIKITIQGKQQIFFPQNYDQIQKFIFDQISKQKKKIVVSFQYKGASLVQSTYKFVPTSSSFQNYVHEQHSKDISNPVVFVLSSGRVVQLPHLNWRINYIGVVFANSKVQELMQIGLSYQKKYRRIKWVIIETEQFQDVPQFLVTQKVLVGSKNVQKQIMALLLKPIRRKLEAIKRQYMQNILKFQTQIKRLGKQVPQNEEGKLLFVWNLIFQFTSKYCDGIKGKVNNSQIVNFEGGIILKALFRSLYRQLTASPILSDIRNSTLEKMIKMYQNDSIPGFPSIQSFKYVLTPHLYKLKQPAIDLVNDIYNYLRVLYSQAIRQKMDPYGNQLVDEVLSIVDNFMKQLYKNTLKIVLDNIECQIQVIMSNNYQYNQKHSDLVPKGEWQQIKRVQMSLIKKQDQNASQRQNTIVSGFRNRVQSYFKLVVDILQDLIPKNIGYFLILQSKKQMQIQVYRKLLQKTDLIKNIEESLSCVQKRTQLKGEVEFYRQKISKISLYESKLI